MLQGQRGVGVKTNAKRRGRGEGGGEVKGSEGGRRRLGGRDGAGDRVKVMKSAREREST